MRTHILAAAVTLGALTIPSLAQNAAPDAPKLWGKSAEIQAMTDAGKRGNIAQIGPYKANLELRDAGTVGNAAIHPNASEFFYIIDGTVDVKTGGKLIDGKPSPSGTVLGSGIDGGSTVRVSKGDFYIVPAGTPHQLTPVGGKVSDMSLMLPAK